MPYRTIEVQCPHCRGKTNEAGQPVSCAGCTSTGLIQSSYHYRGRANLSPEDAAMLDNIMLKVGRAFGSGEVKEMEDNDL